MHFYIYLFLLNIIFSPYIKIFQTDNLIERNGWLGGGGARSARFKRGFHTHGIWPSFLKQLCVLYGGTDTKAMKWAFVNDYMDQSHALVMACYTA